MFGKLFEKRNGTTHEGKSGGSGSANGGGGGGSIEGGSGNESETGKKTMLGRKPSTKKTNPDQAPIQDPIPPVRQNSTTTSKLLGVPKVPSEKAGGEPMSSSSKLRDMVGVKLGRKPSSSKGARSEDGKSDGGSQGTSTLLKKYGVCEKAAIGKGATAVVRLAHKWDRGTDKLYAVKEFRKRRKNESEKEYVKKLTSEFCISSTLSVSSL